MLKLPTWYSACSGYALPGPDRATPLEGAKCPSCGETTIYCCRNDFGHAESLLANGADIRAKDDAGRTPLAMIAEAAEHSELAAKLMRTYGDER